MNYKPWEGTTYLSGTDGMQFHPLVSRDEILDAFVNDLSRSCYFEYSKSDYDTYPGLENMIFEISPIMMHNFTSNPANAKYQIVVDGTTNMTTTLKAQTFASKGHYY